MRYITALATAFLSFVIVSFGFAGVANAADLSDTTWIDIAKPVLDAAISGSPALACALALVLAVSLARRYGAPRWPVLATDAGGTALTFLGSLGAACAAAISGGALPSLGLLWTSLTIAAGASGGYTAIKRLAVPAIRWIESKLPAKLRPFAAPLFSAILWAFESRKSAATKVAEAEAAGAAAVKAKPAPGAAGVVRVGKSFP